MNPYDINPLAVRDRKPVDGQNLEKNVPAEMQEISWSEQDVLQSYLPFANNPDPIVRVKSLKIYREMLQDDQVKVCSEIRKQARLSSTWDISPGKDNDTRAEEMADFIKDCLNRMRGTFEDDLYQIYSAIDYGFSISEKVFEVIEKGKWAGKIGLRAIKTREPFNYDFKVDPHGNMLGIIYTGISSEDRPINDARTLQPGYFPGVTMRPPNNSLASLMPGNSQTSNWGTISNPFPPEKFIVYSYNMTFGNWYGKSDLAAAFKWWIMKKHGSKFWAVWLERYASPFIWAQYKRDAGLKKSALDAIDDFIRNLSTRQGVRVSDAIEIKTVEFGGQGFKSYEQAIEAYNRYISHAILVPNLIGFSGSQGSGSSKGGGSYALGRKQFDAFEWMLDKLGRDTAETIVGDQIIKQLIDLNFPDVEEDEYPRFIFTSVDDETIDIRSKIITLLAQNNLLNPDEEWVREFMTLPKRDPNLPLPQKIQMDRFGNPIQDPNNPNGNQKTNPQDNPKDTKPADKPEDTPKEDASKKEDQPVENKSEFKEREPNVFEKKLKVKKYKKDIEDADQALFAEAMIAIENVRDDMIDQVKRKKIIESGDAAAIDKIAFNAKELKDVFLKWSVKIFLDSKLKTLEEIGDTGAQVDIVRKFAEQPAAMEPWQPLPPQDAIDFFNRKVKAKIVNQDGKKVILDMATGLDMAFMKQRAFTIASVVKDGIINEAHSILLNGIKRMDEAGTISDLKDMFNKYIDQGEEVDEELLKPYRLQTIVRTNVTEAINAGRAAMMLDPDVQGFVQYWEYSAIMDFHTTDYCSCMDGKIFRIDDLLALNPPAHYNCRSYTVPITKFEIQDLKDEGRGVEVAQPCPDRASEFLDIKRSRIEMPKLVTTGIVDPSGKGLDPKIDKRIPTPSLDSAPAQRTQADIETDNKLRKELMTIITRCPYTGCWGGEVTFSKRLGNVGEYICSKCELPFRISRKGDIYLYDAGTEHWQRVSERIIPSFFSSMEGKMIFPIERCPEPTCASENINAGKKIFNVLEYQCSACDLMFRVSAAGDIYFYDYGIEKWERVTKGAFPKFFKEKEKK